MAQMILLPLLEKEYATGCSVYNKLAKNKADLKNWYDIFYEDIVIDDNAPGYLHNLCITTLSERLSKILLPNIQNTIYRDIVIREIVNNFLSTSFFYKEEFSDAFKLLQVFENLNYAYYRKDDFGFIIDKAKLTYDYDSFFDNEPIWACNFNISDIVDELITFNKNTLQSQK